MTRTRTRRHPVAGEADAVGAAEAASTLLREASARLRSRAGDRTSARIEAEVLLAHVVGIPRARLIVREHVTDADRRRFVALVEERARTGRPVAYLTGRRGFRELELAVDERVLVPRPESEHLVEVLLELDAAGRLPDGPVVDRGTGSGALALALAGHLRRTVVGSDVSADALAVARGNVLGHGAWVASGRPATRRRVAGRLAIPLVRADGLDCFRGCSLAAIVTNPPYVEPSSLASLPEDVRRHEPLTALVPAEGSVEALFERVVGEARRVLRPGGWLVTEVGEGQAASVEARLRRARLVETFVVPDLAGIPRVVAGRRPPEAP